MIPPPGVCPRPGSPVSAASSVACPLWPARERLQFQRSIEADVVARPSLGQCVWVDFNRQYRRSSSEQSETVAQPNRPGLPCPPEPVVIPITKPQKGATNV